MKPSKRYKVLIAAAGQGTRSGLSYPKTLFSIAGQPILLRLLNTLAPYDEFPSIIVSPNGNEQIKACLQAQNLPAELIEQPSPKGMGDAVLQIEQSQYLDDCDDVILVWGDIAFLQSSTVETLLHHHEHDKNHLSIATKMVEKAYTRVIRQTNGQLIDLLETREQNQTNLTAGERDIGLFVFKKDVILKSLKQEHPQKYGKTTAEHGFLYLVNLLVSQGYRVGAYPCASPLDLVSFNQKDDIKDYI
jgi:bifunctional UDP-N-acetylglucosamine pyrophosphorylase/glucosamine-1-phosphate N-acetyltransferase